MRQRERERGEKRSRGGGKMPSNERERMPERAGEGTEI